MEHDEEGTIRLAAAADLPSLLEIERANMRARVDALSGRPWSDEDCLCYLRGQLEAGRLWVLDTNGAVTGHYAYSPMKASGFVSLDTIQVVRERQGRGLGGLLLSDFLTRIEAAGFTHAALNVHVGNPAIHLYERFGFARVRETPSYIRMESALSKQEG